MKRVLLVQLRLLAGVVLFSIWLGGCSPGDEASGSQGAVEVSASQSADEAQALKAAGCAGCHQGPLALTGRAVDDVLDELQAIAAGTRAHPPVSLEGLSEADLTELARSLTAGE